MPNHTNKAEASRRNGARSNGPVTEEGKAASAQNSLKHGLTSSNLYVLHNENPEAYARLLDSCIRTFRPKDDLEQELVEEIAGARWRLRRIRTMETQILNTKMDDQLEFLLAKRPKLTPELRQALAFSSLADNSMSLPLLGRYEARLQRTYERAVDNLKKLRALVKQEEPQPAETKDPAPFLIEVPNEPEAFPANTTGPEFTPQPQPSDPFELPLAS